MVTLYKLTDADGRTYGGCQWGENSEHTAPGTGPLCKAGWIHAYTHPLLAVFLNPIHANFANPLLWEADGDVGAEDHGLKVGCTRLRTLREIPLPALTTAQRVRAGILAAKVVCDAPKWLAWADRWLSGEDRSESSAWEAVNAADAADAQDAARAAWAACSGALAAGPAVGATVGAAWAARAALAAAETTPLDLVAIIERAIRDEPDTN